MLRGGGNSMIFLQQGGSFAKLVLAHQVAAPPSSNDQEEHGNHEEHDSNEENHSNEEHIVF